METEEEVKTEVTTEPEQSPGDKNTNDENTTIETPGTEGTAEVTPPTQTESISLGGGSSEPQVVIPIEIREYTPFVTESGNINVIHEITIGELLVCTLIMALLIFTVIGRVIRR